MVAGSLGGAIFASPQPVGRCLDLVVSAQVRLLDELQRRARRGHVITQHGLLATGPLSGPQLRLHRTQGSDRSLAQVTHRTIARAQSLRTPRIASAKSAARGQSANNTGTTLVGFGWCKTQRCTPSRRS